MKKGSTLFLKAAILLIGATMLAVCVYALPRVIGTFSIEGYDPILLSLYIPALPFFFALYQSMKILTYIDKSKVFTHPSVASFRMIKYCAAFIASVFTLGMPYIFYVADKDDAPGVVVIGLVIIFTSFVIATFASVLQKVIQNAVDIKSENDLTV